MWKETPAASTDATTLAGETPTAFGLLLLTDGNAADALETLELGGLATQEANAIAVTGGSVTGITDLAVADGGTGASTAAGARTNLGLGTIATATAGTTPLAYTGASSATFAPLANREDLCAGGDVADLITSTPTGWFTANTANSTIARASNVVTMTRLNAGGSEDRNNGTFPYIARKFGHKGGRLVARFNCTGSADFRLGGAFVHIGSVTSAGYVGSFSWATSYQAYSATYSSPTGGTVTITQSQYIWTLMDFSSAGATVYYSTSTTEPTEGGASAATTWVKIGFIPMVAATSVGGMAASLLAGAHTCYIAGTLAQYVATFTVLRMEWE